MNNSEFYHYYYKGKEVKLTPEEKRRRSELAYRDIMERRKTASGRKSIALAMIGVDYEDIQRSASKKDWDSVFYQGRELDRKIDALCTKYGITDEEVKAYFVQQKYDLSLFGGQ